MAYRLHYSDYPGTALGPPDPARWVGPPGPPGPQGPPGIDGTQGLTHVVVADTAPPGAPDSTLWWDSSGTGLYVRYNDGNSTQWVVAENQVPAGGTQSVVNVLDHGAKGDGTTDDAPAFQAALAAVAAGGKIVVPSGYYNIGAPLSQAITGTVTFEGAGSGNTILSFSAPGDGLTFSLPSNENVHVRGFTFIRAVSSGAAYANTGLTITTPGSDVALHYGQTTLDELVFIGGSYFWLTQIYVYNCQTVSFSRIDGTLPNANGTNTGVSGISVAGQAGASYLTDAKFSHINFQGGSVGLQVGDWVQGIYVVNSGFAGNDYGIRWSGVSGDADLWLAVANVHCNSGTRGILAYQAEGTQITNTYHLHFGIPSLDGIYVGIECYNMDGGLISNNNIYCTGLTSPSTTEYGIRMMGGNSSVIHGNRISNPKTAGILLDSAITNTIVTATLGTAFPTGVPLIQDTTSNPNQKYGNQRNGIADIWTDSTGTLNTSALTINGPLDTRYLLTSGSTASYTTQGGYLMWNRAGNGMTNLVNNRGLGGGGFSFVDTNGTTDVTLLTMTTATNLVLGVLPVNAANDVAAAAAGVPVGGVYRNGSALMVRVV